MSAIRKTAAASFNPFLSNEQVLDCLGTSTNLTARSIVAATAHLSETFGQHRHDTTSDTRAFQLIETAVAAFERAQKTLSERIAESPRVTPDARTTFLDRILKA